MARRRNSKTVLEWVSVVNLSVADSTRERELIDLVLDDDEIAEIWAIDNIITIDGFTSIANSVVGANCTISMDPSAGTAASFISENFYEDLETIFTHREEIVIEFAEATETGVWQAKMAFNKQQYFHNFPVVVANNLSQLVSNIGVAEAPACDYMTRIYFTRKRATDMELARTLLKRR